MSTRSSVTVTLVMGNLFTRFKLFETFRSWVSDKHGTDGQTNGRTDETLNASTLWVGIQQSQRCV